MDAMKPLSDSEVVAIVRDRVGSQLPDAPHTVIGEEVAKSLQAYADCKVRDFVPILVERETLPAYAPAARSRPRQPPQTPATETCQPRASTPHRPSPGAPQGRVPGRRGNCGDGSDPADSPSQAGA